MRCMDTMNHSLEVNRLVVGTELLDAGTSRINTLGGVGHVGVVASDADVGLVGAVVAVQGQLVMAIIALVDINDAASWYRRSVCDWRVSYCTRYSDAIDRAILVCVYRRVSLDNGSSRANGIIRNGNR